MTSPSHAQLSIPTSSTTWTATDTSHARRSTQTRPAWDSESHRILVQGEQVSYVAEEDHLARACEPDVWVSESHDWYAESARSAEASARDPHRRDEGRYLTMPRFLDWDCPNTDCNHQIRDEFVMEIPDERICPQ